MRIRPALIGLMALLAFLVGACNLPRPSTTGAIGNEDAKTAAALTVQALGTQLAGGTIPAPISAITLTPPAVANGTVQSVTTNPPAALTIAPATNQAPAGPTATLASAPPATATPIPTPCDQVALDGETIPDGTTMNPGQTFTKTWTLKNSGTCTWTASYSLVFISGEAMGSPAAQPVTTGQVVSGQSVQVSVNLTAPSTSGTFRANFKLRNAGGIVFGLGPAADQNFWVEIKVAGTATPGA